MELTTQELQNQLDEQVDFLQSSINLYLSGKTNEYKRISVAIRIIFHNTNRQKSLTSELFPNGLRIIDTSGDREDTNEYDFYGLTAIRIASNNASHIPKFNQREKYNTVDRESWWEEVILSTFDKEIQFSRKSLILVIADKYGGAHVDKKMPSQFMDVINRERLNVQHIISIGEENIESSLDSVIPPTVIQIAYEVVKSFRPNYEVDLKEYYSGYIYSDVVLKKIDGGVSMGCKIQDLRDKFDGEITIGLEACDLRN